jgi:hypothetical protein
MGNQKSRSQRSNPVELEEILERIEAGIHTDEDLTALRRLLSDDRDQVVQQLSGKYNIYIGQGQNIQIGDRYYASWSNEAIQALIQVISADQNKTTQESYLHPGDLCCDRQALEQYL